MRIAFAIEDQLGHRALLANLRASLAAERTVEPIWCPVDPRGEGFLAWPRVRDKHALVFGLKLRKLMRDVSANIAPDAFFVHTQRMAHFAVDHMRKVPTFLSIDATPRELDDIYGPLTGNVSRPHGLYWKIRDAVHRRTYRAARGVITMSDLVARTLSNSYGVDPGEILVLLPGVDTDAWRPLAARRPGGQIRLLFVGAEFERKGGDLLLRWARETSHRNFKLDIITRSAVEPHPGVTVHGQFKAGDQGLIQLVQQADLLVHPTRADMSPWVISEAKAAGTAVLSTRVGGIPELVREGIDGHIVAPNDYAGFSARLEQMLSDTDALARYGVRAREDAVERLDASRNARRLIDFIQARLN